MRFEKKRCAYCATHQCANAKIFPPAFHAWREFQRINDEKRDGIGECADESAKQTIQPSLEIAHCTPVKLIKAP